MLKLISHRGNLLGPNLNKENSPDYILTAIKAGFDVEIDVWFINNQYFLGHDKPKYQINKDFLCNQRLWCHAKNVEALNQMRNDGEIHCFWHQNDHITMTSKNFLLVFPGMKVPRQNAIVMLPELHPGWNISQAVGICSDFILSDYSKIKIE